MKLIDVFILISPNRRVVGVGHDELECRRAAFLNLGITAKTQKAMGYELRKVVIDLEKELADEDADS